MAIATLLKPSVPKRLPPPIAEPTTMKWTTPRVVEFAVGLEINSYARAELPAYEELNLPLSRPVPHLVT